MAAEEVRLRQALIGQVGNALHGTCGADVLRFIVGCTGVPEIGLSIKPFHQNSFLVQCTTQATKGSRSCSQPDSTRHHLPLPEAVDEAGEC